MNSQHLKQIEKHALTSKLRPPQLRHVLERPRLLKIASPLSEEQLLLICAGPGYGKTTLMAQMAKYHPGASVWYQVDSLDQDIAFFVKHLILGVSQACNGIGGRSASQLVQAGDIRQECRFILSTLMDELREQLETPLMLCFDDFHLVEKADYLEWLIPFLVEELPANCDICIATRSLKNTAAGKLRARGLVKEITAHDLQFSFEEVRELLTDSWKMPFDESVLPQLLKTTEGWAAGLVLAEEHLRSGKVMPEIISGSKIKTGVYQYMAEEALGRLSDRIRTVLENCSLTDPIDPAICEAAFDCADVTAALATAERLNLFTARLDDTNLFRFHPMFRDFLLGTLFERVGESGVHSLRSCLGAAFEAANQKKQAVDQFLGASHIEKAIGLIECIGSEMLNDGEYLALSQFLGVIPKSMNKKIFSIYEGQLALAMGHPRTALKLLKAIKQSLNEDDIDLILETSKSIAESLRMLGNPEAAAKEIEPLVKMGYSAAQIMELLHLLGFYYWHSYDEKGVKKCVKEANSAVKQDPSFEKLGKVEVMSAGEYIRHGEFPIARRILNQAIGIEDFSASFKNLYLNNLASCLTMMGDYEEAKIYAELCLERMTGQQEEKWIHVLYDTYGCILTAKGNFPLGISYIKKSISKVNDLGLGISESCAAMCHLGSISRRAGDLVKAREYHYRGLESAKLSKDYYDVAVGLANLGGDLIRLGEQDDAVMCLDEAHSLATKYGFKYALTQIDYQHAWAAYINEEFEKATKYLEILLQRADRFYHNHYLIQEGKVTLPLYLLALNNGIQIDYIFKILRHFGKDAFSVVAPLIEVGSKEIRIKCAQLIGNLASKSSITLAQKLAKDQDDEVSYLAKKALKNIRVSMESPDKLFTRRELQILELLASGDTNESIARKLFISERTVKTHVTNILRKGGVRNRIEAALYYQQNVKNHTLESANTTKGRFI